MFTTDVPAYLIDLDCDESSAERRDFPGIQLATMC